MFHVSTKYLGKSVMMIPSVPDTRNKKECAVTKRICASPTILQCILAIDGIKDLKYSCVDKNGWYIYQTSEIGLPAKDVFDYHLTEEHWFTKNTEFIFVGKVFLNDENELLIDQNVVMSDFDNRFAEYVQQCHLGLINKKQLIALKKKLYSELDNS